MKFSIGENVYKTGSGYSGPGIVMAAFQADDATWRYVVRHEIKDGEGGLYHIYSQAQLRKHHAAESRGQRE